MYNHTYTQRDYIQNITTRMSDDEENTVRILLASDNHLGYCEKDPIRTNDSFAAFEEILQTAVEEEVDMVLLGGDLFHENKPSRMSVFKAISLLRKYCLGDKQIEIKVVSQQEENFRNKRVNYEDPNFNIGLPVFSINGNHDDPTRESGTEALSACDILSAGNFLNYFGTASRINDINIKPVLIEKGSTKLALYGLGAVRDERLSRMFSKDKVKFVRPKEEVKEYFNMFVLHQNRDTGRGVKNCVHESFLPSFLDLVMWGHEHECKIDPVPSTSGYHITQPGSSVATSLVESEAAEKHVGILSILGTNFKIEKTPLQSVRPFVHEIIKLSDFEELKDLNGQTHTIDIKVHDILTKYVYEAIENAHIEFDTKNGYQGLSRDEKGRVLPLIRLKVERSALKEGDKDFPNLNVQRFGNQFAGKVANPSSLLKFFKTKKGTGKKNTRRREGENVNDLFPALNGDDDDKGIRGADMSNRIVMELEKRNTKLELLPEPALNDALNKYVVKEEAQALRQFVNNTIRKTQKALKRRNNMGDDAATIRELIAEDTDRVRRENLPKKRKTIDRNDDDDDDDDDEDNRNGSRMMMSSSSSSSNSSRNNSRQKTTTTTTTTNSNGGTSKRRKVENGRAKAVRQNTGKKKKNVIPKGRSRKKKQPSSSEEEEEDSEDIDSDFFDSDEDMDSNDNSRKTKNVSKKSTTKKGMKNSSGAKSNARGVTSSRRTSSRTAAKTKPNYVESLISDDDDSSDDSNNNNVVDLVNETNDKESYIPSSDEDEDSVIISKSRAKRKTAGRKSTTSTKKRTKNPPRRRYGARSQK